MVDEIEGQIYIPVAATISRFMGGKIGASSNGQQPEEEAEPFEAPIQDLL
jgi:hypothetical protein